MRALVLERHVVTLREHVTDERLRLVVTDNRDAIAERSRGRRIRRREAERDGGRLLLPALAALLGGRLALRDVRADGECGRLLLRLARRKGERAVLAERLHPVRTELAAVEEVAALVDDRVVIDADDESLAAVGRFVARHHRALSAGEAVLVVGLHVAAKTVNATGVAERRAADRREGALPDRALVGLGEMGVSRECDRVRVSRKRRGSPAVVVSPRPRAVHGVLEVRVLHVEERLRALELVRMLFEERLEEGAEVAAFALDVVVPLGADEAVALDGLHEDRRFGFAHDALPVALHVRRE